ncbi:MAG: glycoside hydrolase family 5 protein [Eubacteriales bacterium]|nr:glycoside hydrolase family 5 protein [Eubacteriales bacterium]
MWYPLLLLLPIFMLLLALFFLYRHGEAIRFAENMGAGWNLGNTLDAHSIEPPDDDILSFEQVWGNPPASREIFETVRAAGFRTLRLPVSWFSHTDEDGNIDDAWMDRVQQVVDEALDCNFYVILNAHHEDWLSLDGDPAALERNLCTMWSQIASRFAFYDERLLFEGMNEPRLVDHEEEWTSGTPEANAVLMDLNDAFVRTVRQSGGNNEKRYLLVTPYAGNPEPEAIAAFRMPKDRRVMVTVHGYKPYRFAANAEGTAEWSASNAEDTQWVDETFPLLYNTFIRRGVPVILGEFGALDKNNTQTRAAWADYLVTRARENKIICIWWDDGGRESRPIRYALLDRRTLSWYYPQIVEKLCGK